MTYKATSFYKNPLPRGLWKKILLCKQALVGRHFLGMEEWVNFPIFFSRYNTILNTYIVSLAKIKWVLTSTKTHPHTLHPRSDAYIRWSTLRNKWICSTTQIKKFAHRRRFFDAKLRCVLIRYQILSSIYEYNKVS